MSLVFVSLEGERPVGFDNSDEYGEGVIDVLVPSDAPLGHAVIRVTTEGGCTADAPFVVVGSLRSISIDDQTVIPGQRVTLRAGGFMENGHVAVSIDTFPTQGECWPRPCRFLGTANTSAVGSVVIQVRIPRDTAPGPHSLWVSGYVAGGETEDSLGVDITVVGGTLPPTDTAS